MLKDKKENLSRYLGLDDSLSSFSVGESEVSGEYSSFVVDRKSTTVFFVEKGTSSFATGWRENRDNREVLGVITAGEGEFVLYLPGEPMVAKPSEGSVIRVWRKN